MRNFFTYKVTLFSLLLLTTFSLLLKAPPLQAMLLYCWNNDDGIEECSNSIPSQYSQRGFKECKIVGFRRKCKDVKPAPTDEEIAQLKRQEQEKQKRQEQTHKDCQFLNTFSSVTDIEHARATARATIDAQKQPIEMLIEALKGNLEDQKTNYELSQKNSSVPENQLNALLREITAVENSIAEQNKVLQSQLKEKAETQQNYNNYVQRYQYLKDEDVVGCQQDKEGNFYFICEGKGKCQLSPK
ncbi:MAG: hypothetical protein DRR19_21175 [Candidatus Parabeggiatoa sp. nov. 1]|nr:MAG: hypothetical protein DRR19_21175 [Gammaproteobacteria bacterium]